jgi:hypothetical protein
MANSPPTHLERRGFVLRRNWPAVVGCALVAAGGILAPHFLLGPMIWPLSTFAIVIGGGSSLAILVRNGFPHAWGVNIEADKAGLRIGGEPPIPLERILEAKMVPRERGTVVVMLGLAPKGTLSLRLPETDAIALLTLIGNRRTRFSLDSPPSKRLLIAGVIWLAIYVIPLLSRTASFSEALGIALGAIFIFVLPVTWLLGLVRGRVVIGADGLTIRWLWRERFVPFSDVRDIQMGISMLRHGLDTKATLRSGKKLRLTATETPNTKAERDAEGRAMLARIREAFAAWRPSGALVDVGALAQNARSPHDWRVGIDAVLSGGYRVAAISVEALAQVVADATVARDARVGAAAALVRIGSDESRSRVRVAAEACAESDLRGVLKGIAEAEDDASVEAVLSTLRAR